MRTCPARTADYPTAHTCDHPLACAMTRWTDGVPAEVTEVERLHDLLDGIEDLCDDSTAKVATDVLTLIHTERGGPHG